MLLKSISISTSSMEKSLSKITVIFQLMGIQCFSILPETIKGTRTNSLSRIFKWILVVNIVLTISEFCAILYAIRLSPLDNTTGNAALGQVVQYACYNFMIVMLVTSAINSLLLRKKAMQIFKNCKIISTILVSLNQYVDYETFADEFKKSFAKLLLCFIGSSLAALIFVFLSNNTIVFLWAVLAIYPFFYTVIMFSYWIFLVRLVREHLRFVKASLLQLQKNDKIFRIDPETRNHDSKMRRNHETYNFFVKLKRVYGVICDTTSIVNDFMAVPICLIIIFIFITNVSSGYKIFLSFRNDVPVERVAVPLFTIFITLTSLCMLVFSCSSTYATTDELLTQVYKFECSKLDRECDISAILTEFSMQIVQRPIEFTVGGFCYLTQPLLATIITGITTYVMLLVQFSTT